MSYGESSAVCDGHHVSFGTDIGEIEDGDDIFCSDCYKALQEEVEELGDEIETLKQKNAELDAELVELKQ